MANKSKAKAKAKATKDYAVCHLAATLFKKIGEPSYRDKNAIHAALRHAYEHGVRSVKPVDLPSSHPLKKALPGFNEPYRAGPAKTNAIWCSEKLVPLDFLG